MNQTAPPKDAPLALATEAPAAHEAVFVQPDAQELEEAGLNPSSEAVEAALPRADQEAQAASWAEILAQSSTFKARWAALDELEPQTLLNELEAALAHKPQAWREALIVSLAKELGYQQRFHKGRQGLAKPLLDLLVPSRFETLSPTQQDLLWAIADSTTPARRTLHPMAATACLSLWRNSAKYHEQAHALLSERPLPDDPQWMLAVVWQLHKKAKTPERDLLRLVQQQLDAKYWNASAMLCALSLLVRYGGPTHAQGDITLKLERVCDQIAQERPHQEAIWLEHIAYATLGGHLDHPWLERIIEACIRLNIHDPARQAQLRSFHAARPYEADERRLRKLYAPHIKLYQRSLRAKRAPKIPASLDLRLIAQTLIEPNPRRAQHLFEIMTIERAKIRGRASAHDKKLTKALKRCGTLDPQTETLAKLIVKNVDVSPQSARFVREHFEHIDWDDQGQLASRQDLDLYLVISDYERAFKHLTCKYDGITLRHSDKHAAERLKYFIQKRLEPGNATRMIEAASAPIQWVGQHIASAQLLQRVVSQALHTFEQRSLNIDLSEQVVRDLKLIGLHVEHFDQIAQLGLDQLHLALQQRRNQRILIGAISGGLSGGLAPMSWSVISLTDIPVLLGLAADICNRFCWYFGFDPRQHPDLPMTILAVALGGTRPQAIEPMLLRQNLQEFVVHKSIVMGSLGQGAMLRAATKTFNQYIEQRFGPKLASKAQALAKKAVSQNLQQRAAQAGASKRLPIFGAVLGAALNGALIYDICEAAQAVLTDRFLERKYPEWLRQLDIAQKPSDHEPTAAPDNPALPS